MEPPASVHETATFRMPSPRTARQVGSALNTGHVCAALQCLNARTRFRFTGLYNVDPPWLRNVALFDRENPGVNISGQVSPITIGFCGLVCATGMPFVTADARRDPLLATHPARESMLSYCGVPIRRHGVLWGTLCHFDLRPRIARRGETELLASLVPLFTEWMDQSMQADQ